MALKAIGQYLDDSEDRDQPTQSTDQGELVTQSMAMAEATSVKIDTQGAAMSPSAGEVQADTPRFAAFMEYISGSTADEATKTAENHESSPAAAEEGNAKPPTHPSLQYNYSNRYPTKMDNFTTSQNSKTRVGKRCYRLNLERPFDIHCEQSPLVSCMFDLDML